MQAECVLEEGHCYDRYNKSEDFNDISPTNMKEIQKK
jgi:hypothetical protein